MDRRRRSTNRIGGGLWRRSALRCALTLWCVGWALGAAVAQADAPALTLFDEVAQHLRLAYGGRAEIHPSQLLPTAREALVARCDGWVDCPEHVGLVVRAPRGSSGLVVLDVVPGSAAARADITRGDRILALDGVPLAGAACERLGQLEDAVAGGCVRALVLRAGAPPRRVDLVPGPVPRERPPSLTWLADGVGWLRVPSLLPAEVVVTDVHLLVAVATSVGADGLIVDLRDNLGGTYAAVVAAACAFQPTVGRLFVGPMVGFGLLCDEGLLRLVDPFGQTRVSDTLPVAARWGGELVVLVNAHTLSCAESLAWELQRHAGARVVGEATAGLADTAVQTLPLSNGMRLVLTVATVYDLDGSPVPARVTPDVFVLDDPLRLAEGHDDPLDVALRLPVPRRP